MKGHRHIMAGITMTGGMTGTIRIAGGTMTGTTEIEDMMMTTGMTVIEVTMTGDMEMAGIMGNTTTVGMVTTRL